MNNKRYFYKCPACNKQAFELKEMPNIDDVILAENTLFKDGSSPKAGDNIACELCGEEIDELTVDNIITKTKWT